MRKYFFTLLLYISSVYFACASAVGTWHVYPSYANLTEISPAGDVCFGLASGSLFAYNNATGEMTTFNKTTGLAGIEINHIAWSQQAKRLVVAYSDGNIDLVSAAGDITNVPGLHLSTVVSDKAINNIYIDGHCAYMSIGVGVMKLDAKKGVIADTYQLGFAVDHSYVKDGYLYAVSKAQGTWRGLLTDNLLDKNRWQRVGGYTALTDNRINVRDASTGLWWTRNDAGRLACYTLAADGTRTYKTEGVLPEGPASNRFYRLYMHGGKLYSVGGAFAEEIDGNYSGEVKIWDGMTWSLFEQPTRQQLGHNNVDYLCLDFDPQNEGHVMVGAKSGLYEFQNGKFVKCYSIDNSPLESAAPDNNLNYVMASAVKYDMDGNLWVLNNQSDDPIKQLSNDNKWNVFSHKELAYDDAWDLKRIFISQTNGYMWFVNNHWEATRVYAYDYKNDKLYFVGGPIYNNEDGTNITPIYLFDIQEDIDRNVWIATSSGPLYFTQADIMNCSGNVVQHKVPRNDGTNLADYLLGNIETRCIAFDGGNRKWIGTSDGLFIISDDCNTQIGHYTVDNSPLPSNIIHDILVDKNSNMVYIATDKGLCSYSNDATEPSEIMDKDNVYAYPNPVTPEYTGDVTIVGLSFNADVKIVTSNGVLVNSGRSIGGTYKWNGRDLKGKRVTSGVYMVETATQDGGKGVVCKIAIVN